MNNLEKIFNMDNVEAIAFLFGEEKAQEFADTFGSSLSKGRRHKKSISLKKMPTIKTKKLTVKTNKVTVTTMVNRFEAKDKMNALKFIGAIKNNKTDLFKSDIVNITMEELAEDILKGKSIIPAVIEGKIEDANFKQQQLFLLDIDNINTSLESLKAKFKAYPPALIYTSFSHTAEHPKYRLGFIADKFITDPATARKITLSLMNIAECSDEKCVDVSRIFFAGRNIIETNNITFNVDKLLANSTVTDAEVAINNKEKVKIAINGLAEEAGEDNKTITIEEVRKNLSTITEFRGIELDYATSFDWIKSHVDLAIALGKPKNKLFRCLHKDHLDKHPSASIFEYNGYMYYRCSCNKFKPTSVIDTLAEILNLSLTQVQYLIADALGISIGSAYQKNMRLLIAETKAKMNSLIKPDTLLYKEMTYLWGALNVIQDFAIEKVSITPLTNNSFRPTFFIGRSEIESRMQHLKMAGASNVKSKIDQLKDLGFIRPLNDEELIANALENANKNKDKNIILKGKTTLNRCEFYELCEITPEFIAKAEEKIKLRKKLGAKKSKMNIVRRLNTYGLEHTLNTNVQGNVLEKYCNNKDERIYKRIIKHASILIKEKGYFTEKMLREHFDPKRTIRKDKAILLINNCIPLIMQQLDLIKDRVKKENRIIYSISDRVSTNTTIYRKLREEEK